MRKKIWIGVLMLCFVFVSVSTGSHRAAANQCFPDVGNHWAKDYINQLTSRGYMAGYPDGTFKPDKIMTRAEFTSVLISGMGFTASDKASRNFSDTSGSWAIASINEAVDRDILIPGEYPNGLVPDGGIKRSEACAMLVRALGKPAGTGILPFKDTAQLQASMYVGYIKTASDLGIMNGFPNGNFEPFSEMPRAQACTVLYNLLAQQGKVPATPPATTSTTPAVSTGSIKYVSIDTESYDINTTPISFILNFQEIPVKSMVPSTTSINVNNSYSFDLNSRGDNPDMVVYNNRYGIDELTVSGDKLVVTPTYRKVYKFTVGDYIYNSDYTSLYVNSANKDYYLSDMGIIDKSNVKIGDKNYNLSSDKITISVQNGGSSTVDFYDIIKVDLSQQDTIMKLAPTDPVVMSRLGISNITAIFTGDTILNLDNINQIHFIMGGKRYSLAKVTIDASGNFSVGGSTYPFSQITMIVDGTQYKINSLNVNNSKFIFYCGEGVNHEWVVLDDEYLDADDVRIIKGTTVYTLDEALVVARNVIRINGRQYSLDSDFKCKVDNKIYYIDEIDYDPSLAATIIETGDLADSIANQPSRFIFYNDDDKYYEGIKNVIIYANGRWISFSQVFISDPSHFIYRDNNYKLIGAKIDIDDIEFRVTDTSWRGATQVLDIYLEEL